MAGSSSVTLAVIGRLRDVAYVLGGLEGKPTANVRTVHIAEEHRWRAATADRQRSSS